MSNSPDNIFQTPNKPSSNSGEMICGCLDCAICLSPIQEQNLDYKGGMTSTSCKHQFHRNCLVTVLFHQKNCPICRSKLVASVEKASEYTAHWYSGSIPRGLTQPFGTSNTAAHTDDDIPPIHLQMLAPGTTIAPSTQSNQSNEVSSDLSSLIRESARRGRDAVRLAWHRHQDRSSGDTIRSSIITGISSELLLLPTVDASQAPASNTQIQEDTMPSHGFQSFVTSTPSSSSGFSRYNDPSMFSPANYDTYEY